MSALHSVRRALPGPVVALVRHEARLLQSLALWARGRRDGVLPGATALPGGRDGRVLGLALLAASLVEVVVVELVVPWPAVRAALLVVGLYGVVLVLASIADLAVRPHVLTADTLRLRLGAWADVSLPLDAVASAGREVRAVEGCVTLADGVLSLASANQTHVTVALREPRRLRAGRVEGLVRVVRFAADDPPAAAAALRAALERVRPAA